MRGGTRTPRARVGGGGGEIDTIVQKTFDTEVTRSETQRLALGREALKPVRGVGEFRWLFFGNLDIRGGGCGEWKGLSLPHVCLHPNAFRCAGERAGHGGAAVPRDSGGHPGLHRDQGPGRPEEHRCPEARCRRMLRLNFVTVLEKEIWRIGCHFLDRFFKDRK